MSHKITLDDLNYVQNIERAIMENESLPITDEDDRYNYLATKAKLEYSLQQAKEKQNQNFNTQYNGKRANKI